jgi:hypothetical protein
LSEWTIAINFFKSTAIIFARAGRRFVQPRPTTLNEEPIQWFDTSRYLGGYPRYMTHPVASLRSVQEEDCSKMFMLGPLLNREIDLSIGNEALQHKVFIRTMMDYACSTWRAAVRTHVRRLHVLQPTCLRLATGTPWYVSNKQIHKDLGVPLFADHIRVPTASFDSKLADVGNSLIRQRGTYADRLLNPSPGAKSQGRQVPAFQSRPSPAMSKSTKQISFGADQPKSLRLL